MNKRKRLLKRILSFVLAVNLIVANVFFDGMIPFSDLFNTGLTASAAYSPVITDPNSSVFDRDSNGAISLNYSNFKDYAYYYHENAAFAALHKDDKVTLTFGTTDTVDSDYIPLGTSANPFNGSLLFTVAQGVTTYTLKTYQPLFDYISDNAVIGGTVTLNLFNMKAGNFIFANHVKDADTTPGNGTAKWNIELDHRLGTHSADTSESYAGVIGEMMSGARVNLSFTDYLSTAVESDGDTGMICGVMDENSSLSLSLTRTNAAYNVKSTGSGTAAGALVGRMAPGAVLELVKIPEASISSSVTSTGEGSYAGGLVGWANDASVTVVSGGITVGSSVTKVNVIPVKGTIKATTGGAGGLFGYYKNSSESTFDLKNYDITTTVYAKNCGGVFGVLDNEKGTSETAVSFTVENTNDAGTVSVTSGSAGTYADNGCFGGVAGKYVTDDLTNSLVLNGFSVTSTAGASFASFGGVIGLVDSAAYVETTGTVSANASGTTMAKYFGGLIGATSADNGVFVNLGNFTLNTGSEEYKGGGLVGLFNNGVLRLSGTTTMTNAKPASAADCGQLVGKNDNVLTYAASGWTFNRSNGATTDDLGTWGEVVRVAESDIVTVDSTAHTVKLKAADTSMGTPAAFARTALNIQLNQGSDYDCLKFTSGAASTRDTLLASTALSLSGNVSLAGTGITGFMRDGGDVSTIGSFTGTFNGNDKTITLASGESYGTGASGQTEGMGQIYRHQHNGLFAVLAGTVKNLTVDGTINVRNKRNEKNTGGIAAMNIGGIASRNGGSVTLTSVNTNVTVNYHEDSNITTQENVDPDKNIGGYIGFVGTGGTITINGNSTIGATFRLSGHSETWNVYGGAIGKITADTFTVNIGTKGDNSNKLTNSLTTDISGITNVGANSNSGGLIGYITSAGSYGSRTVNLNNVVFSSCKVSNAASTNGGGFLGYAWLNTTTNINGVTVTNGTINNSSAPNVGVMLYSSTGKMKVNSLEINGLTMSTGGGTSLGMIVNNAYDGDNGLYLDVLNAGYDLTGTTAPAQATGIFDEIAAYSAKNNNVINGGNGTGVISINMNADRSTNNANFLTTGTYQNRLKTGDSCANSKSRYYYNVDKMSSSNAGQNLVLWSLSKYAASNISSEFSSTDLSGNADLTGLSFYPLANTEDVTLNGLNVTFDYSGIYTTESGTSNTDSYIRDPGVSNQHYLMHSGLFINIPAGKTVTVTGSSSIGGNFLEVDKYKAALVSDTMNGNLKVTGSLELKGLTPKTTGNTAYTQGYLLVNKVTRSDSQTQSVSLELNNISTSGYSKTAQTAIAKSLIGPAEGRSLSFKFSGIKLDSRKAAVSDTDVTDVNAALTNAYGTSRSIFSDATLVYSINTDQYAELIYNFTRDEDWGTDGSGNRNVTYGSEITNSKEYANQEKKYYGDPRNYTRPDEDSNTEYTFSDNVFLPYVHTSYDPDADHTSKYNREIKVNVVTEVEWEGCGSYNDPYLIKDGKQLEALSKFLLTGNANDLGSIILPVNAAGFNSIDKTTKGDRWCTGETYHALYSSNGDSQFTATGYSAWTAANAQNYLAGAYYKIGQSIELTDEFKGLGGTTANTAFRGVIVGAKNNSGEPGYIITNKSTSPFITVTNGCVIKDISIRVDNNIALSQGNNGYNNAYFGYEHTTTALVCRFYGGIIGEVMGGDNIIDNSYVTFESGRKITLSGNNGSIVPVGGYVGVVVFGALVFKNMDARKTTVANTGLNVVYSNGSTTTTSGVNLANSVDSTNQESWAAIYVNPIVGRVINGYAVNETGGNAKDSSGTEFNQFSVTEDGKYHDENRTSGRSGNKHTLKNGAKHYSIADIDPYYGKTAEQWNALTDAQKNELMLDVTAPVNTSTDGTINVPNAQAMFILSLITQSTSGTAQTADGEYQNSLSYGINSSNVYGMSHNANYTNVGSATVNTDTDYLAASEDTAAGTAVPYIIRRYTTYYDNTETITINIANEGDTLSCDVKYLNGHQIYIKQGTDYMNNIDQGRNNPYGLKATTVQSEAAKWTVELVPGTTDRYYIYTTTNDGIRYLRIWQYSSGNYHVALVEKAQATQLEIRHDSTSKTIYGIGSTAFIDNWGNSTAQGFSAYTDNGISGNRRLNLIAAEDITNSVTTGTKGYPARCVTSTKGYYDINLTDSDYVLPDSFRGIGSVGNWDGQSESNEQEYNTPGYPERHLNPYCMKIDVLNGNGCHIDEDIYLNKFLNDNYFNRLHKGNAAGQSVQNDTFEFSANTNIQTHGIALFDSVVMKSADSKFSDFTLTGSVNTEIYKNDYNSSGKQITGTSRTMGQYSWLCTGGVCGWATDGTHCNFERIDLNNLTLRGSGSVGGLLANSGNRSTTIFITVDRCNATNISLSLPNVWWDENGANSKRNTIGAFVGKVKEGGVKIYGAGKSNTSTNNYATVSLKAFSHYDSNAVIPGGVVGYAGNGLEAYDIRLMPVSDSTNITIGSDNVLMAGGFVGLMQPAKEGNSSCLANFIRCEVQHINVRAQTYAGGFYGGTWDSNWSPYSIKVDQCKVTGKEGTTITNTIQAKTKAGGVIADGFVVDASSPNVIVSNTIVSNYNINTTDNNSSSGGFIGYMGCQKGVAVCYVHDSAIENCKIAESGKYGGGIIGNAQNKAGHKLLGYNVKMDQVTSTSTNMGAWVGKIDNTNITIQFTGLAIYGNGFTKNVGNGVNLGNASFVFSAYDEGKLTSTPGVSELNKGTTVDMPKYPYVNINPQSAIGTGEIITGDGAVKYGETIDGYSGKTGDKTMAAKIYSELEDENNTRRYTSFVDAEITTGKNIGDYLKASPNSEGDRISTWENEMGSVPTGVSDFAMIVIANENPQETTALINRYIQLVTNTITDYSASSVYYNIVPKACEYKQASHKFEITDAAAGISYSAGDVNAFTVNRAGADSLATNKFTLLDVQFKDPLDTSKIAYHLYVPVYVKRSISVTFSSTALSGTDALASNYIPGLSTQGMLIESLDTWFTTYIRYTYGISDLQALLDSGMLGWNGSKQVALNFIDTATGTSLPGNTKLVLIDPNGNADRAFYASGSELGGNTFSLSKFHKSYSEGAAFAEQKLGDIIGGSVKVTASTGCYDLSTASDYDIKVGNNYYKYVGSGNGGYKITAESAYNEDYYISMLFPSSEFVYLFDVNSPRSLPGNMVTYVDPSSAIEQILLGDLYEYEITSTEVTPPDQVITDTNNTITVNMTSKVRLKSTNRGLYASYLNSNNVKLYHADVITLNRYYAGGSDTTLSGYGSIDVTACVVKDSSGNQTDLTNSVEAEVPSNTNIVVSTGDIRSQVTAGIDSDSYQGAAITQTVVIPFNNIDEEFPSRPPDQEGTSQYGVSVSVSSNISYDSDDVVYSSKKVPFSDSKRYYIEKANTATLKYEANDELDKYDSVGAASHNYSHLGNNGLDRSLTCKWPNGAEGMPISATAKYNANAVTNYDDAATIVYTLTLYKKTDTKENGKVTGVQYVQVPIENYLKNVKVYGGDTAIPLTKNQSSDNMRYVYSQAKESANEDEKVFTIGTYYEVVTGPTFHDFANYRVVLEVQLRNSSGTVISNSTQNDYIVYTNAKIYPEVIQQ